MKGNRLSSLIFILILFVSLHAQNSTKGLVLYLPLDGNATDYSPYENNGVIHGATATVDRFGRPGRAMQFDGNSTIVIPGTKELDLTNNKTLSCWIYIPSTETQLWYPTIIFKAEPIKSNSYSLQLTDYFGYNSDQHKLDFFYSSGNVNYQTHTQELYTDFKDQWIHVAGTYDTISGDSKIYFNGILSDSVHFGKIISNSSNSDLYIGGTDPTTYRSDETFFKGKIDEVRIYNRALQATEISRLYREELCSQSIPGTDTLFIKVNITGFNPVSFKSNIKIYPNPGTDYLTVQTDDVKSLYTLKIINSLSQMVYQTTLNQPLATIDLKSWSVSGTYLVQIYDSTNKLIEAKKIILQ